MRFLISAAMLATVALAASASATGVIKCNAGAQSGWKSMDALKAKLTKEGWKVRLAKPDGGCYEVYGTTEKGERVEAYFHPITFEKLYVARRGQVLFRAKGY